jgi:hypothetical protein
MKTERVIGGLGLLVLAVPIVVFLTQADYAAIAHHPARAITTVIVVALAVALLFFGVRLLRSGVRG